MNWFNFLVSVSGVAINLWLLIEQRQPLFAIIAILLIGRAVVFAMKLALPGPPVQDQPNKKEGPA